MKWTLLVVDDEEAARYAVARLFGSEIRVVEAATVAEAREALRQTPPDVALLDYGLPDGDGLALLKEVMAMPAPPAAIMLTAHGSERVAVEAMKSGAYDYLAKPYDAEELRLVVARALERQSLRLEVAGLRSQLAGEAQFGRMAGTSAAMRKLFHTALLVANSDLPVLILGESGTGKDLLAAEIHQRSARAEAPFVALNCAALPEALVESELFGHEKGAFTGAAAARAGRFEQAHHGTLFLDEIGEMTAATQAKILRAAETGAVERLGGQRATAVDVRIISATNRNLAAAVKEGVFREDLYYRLAAVTLEMPPLRERREDIALLAELFWSELRAKYARDGPELGREALARLEAAPWPGNVRQLRTTLERYFVLGDIGLAFGSPVAAAESEQALGEADFREARRRFEAEFLSRKLRENGGNVTRTAEAIGLARQHLQEKIRELGLK